MRNLLHLLLSILLWGVFFYYWEIVAERSLGPGTVLAIKVLAVLVTVMVIVTFWWVAHNLRLAGRPRRRSARPCPAESLDVDVLGRRIEAPPPPALRAAGIVEIEVRDGLKTYRVADELRQVSGEDL